MQFDCPNMEVWGRGGGGVILNPKNYISDFGRFLTKSDENFTITVQTWVVNPCSELFQKNRIWNLNASLRKRWRYGSNFLWTFPGVVKAPNFIRLSCDGLKSDGAREENASWSLKLQPNTFKSRQNIVGETLDIWRSQLKHAWKQWAAI